MLEGESLSNIPKLVASFKYGLTSINVHVVFICMAAISKQRLSSGFWNNLRASDKICAKTLIT